ncbi:MAG: ATP-binding protein [Pseudomonadota bacterium]|nr:GHKL domain-containing protein [Pseudomonadota bacterium]MBU1428268.1 GHKL domain-containing protein [bacterium]
MNTTTEIQQNDITQRLKWLMFFRVFFTTLLLGSTIALQLSEKRAPLDKPLLMLYGLIAGVLVLSFCYTILFYRIKNIHRFASIQIGIDTVFVSCIIFVTGCFSSIFSFLYLLVIIYSTMLLFKKGGMIIAALCAIQYGVIVDLEYYKIIKPFLLEDSLVAANYPWSQVLYKILITIVACFAVAFLSGFLAEQTRKTKKELIAMQERVKRFEKMAAMGEIAAGMAHEIKNPLASISGSIQLLREDIRDNPYHDRLMQIILREADRLSFLVNDFLLFAKPPAGKKEPFELGKIIADTIYLFEKDTKCLGRISIFKDIAQGVWVNMDPIHLHQILWNLLLNASEAIEGSGKIEVKTYNLKNKYALIEITDDGCGISNEEIKSIFDPFFTTKTRGTGLGLSIVHNILKSYDSWLDVESTVNKGATFTFKIKQIDSPSYS